MKIGLLLPTREAVLDGRPETGPLLRLAAAAEAAGLDSVWVGDGPLVRRRHDAFALLGAVAAATSRVRVGTAILVAPLRHPLLVLHQAATVDLLSEGCLTLGLGAGFPMPQTRRQFEALGADYPRRVQRLEDTVLLGKQIWAGAGSRCRGAVAEADDAVLDPPPHQPGGPPMWLAAGGPAGLQRTGRLADGWLPYPPTPDAYADDLAVVRRASDDAGRPCPTPALYATVCLGEDARQARAALEAGVERYYGQPADAVAKVQALFGGTPDELVAWLGAYRQAGAEHVVVRTSGLPTEQAVGHLAAVRMALASSPGQRPRPAVPTGVSR
jgi:alkanesulfonate monooxygenase SsuD/methylene tetrahydromethanopterin reductase-like flavin-dependent oxidoreductase (luciferase family)